MVHIVKDNTIQVADPNWPKHARGRRVLTLTCGHKVYADAGSYPRVCAICKRRLVPAALCPTCHERTPSHRGDCDQPRII